MPRGLDEIADEASEGAAQSNGAGARAPPWHVDGTWLVHAQRHMTDQEEFNKKMRIGKCYKMMEKVADESREGMDNLLAGKLARVYKQLIDGVKHGDALNTAGIPADMLEQIGL